MRGGSMRGGLSRGVDIFWFWVSLLSSNFFEKPILTNSNLSPKAFRMGKVLHRGSRHSSLQLNNIS